MTDYDWREDLFQASQMFEHTALIISEAFQNNKRLTKDQMFSMLSALARGQSAVKNMALGLSKTSGET